eukprot:356853-Chlamydomonas_euryale.AAC.1
MHAGTGQEGMVCRESECMHAGTGQEGMVCRESECMHAGTGQGGMVCRESTRCVEAGTLFYRICDEAAIQQFSHPRPLLPPLTPSCPLSLHLAPSHSLSHSLSLPLAPCCSLSHLLASLGDGRDGCLRHGYRQGQHPAHHPLWRAGVDRGLLPAGWPRWA